MSWMGKVVWFAVGVGAGLLVDQIISRAMPSMSAGARGAVVTLGGLGLIFFTRGRWRLMGWGMGLAGLGTIVVNLRGYGNTATAPAAGG
jgi:hypothetical protein